MTEGPGYCFFLLRAGWLGVLSSLLEALTSPLASSCYDDNNDDGDDEDDNDHHGGDDVLFASSTCLRCGTVCCISYLPPFEFV